MRFILIGLMFLGVELVGVQSSLAQSEVRFINETSKLVFEENEIEMVAEFLGSPVVGQENIMNLRLFDLRTGMEKDFEGEVQVVLWMPSMNHGSAPTSVEPVRDVSGKVLLGQYLVRQIYFTMGGDWEVRVLLKNHLGIEMKAISLNIKKSDHGGHHH